MSLNRKRAKALEILTDLDNQVSTTSKKLDQVRGALSEAKETLGAMAKAAAKKGDSTNTIDMPLVQALHTDIVGAVNSYNLSAKINLPSDPVVEIRDASEPV